MFYYCTTENSLKLSLGTHNVILNVLTFPFTKYKYVFKKGGIQLLPKLGTKY